METMIDELAVAAGRDPLAFRLSLLGQEPSSSSGTQARSRQGGVGQGAARRRRAGHRRPRVVRFIRRAGAEVSLRMARSGSSGWFCAVDCGVPVNPDVIRAQDGRVHRLRVGRAVLTARSTSKRGRAAQRNFDTYRALRIYEMPRVEVHIMPSTEKPGGVGEPGLPPLAPAVANAVAKLGGPRVRRLPSREPVWSRPDARGSGARERWGL